MQLESRSKCDYHNVWSKINALSANLVTTLQAAVRIPQPYAFLCATETVQQWPDPPFPALVMQYIQSWGGSGLVHEISQCHGWRSQTSPCFSF
jgi:hypothetical protein